MADVDVDVLVRCLLTVLLQSYNYAIYPWTATMLPLMFELMMLLLVFAFDRNTQPIYTLLTF